MSHNVLVLNCGSSSLKFAIIDAASGTTSLTGLAECLSLENASLSYKLNGKKYKIDLPEGAQHDAAIAEIVSLIKQQHLDDSLIAVGHRVVHGGEAFTGSVVIDNAVINGIENNVALAPLHNPANLMGIRAAQTAFTNLPQVAVFDTAFHQSMEKQAYLYALPLSLYKEHGVRRYGFHGTSHYFVANEAAKLINKPIEQSAIITAHLGNGCSVTAVKNGKSVDTSMGLTPLEGLVMGTRSGDLDAGLYNYLSSTLNYSNSQIDAMLNKQSGLLGLSELSSDCREIEEAAEKGHMQAKLALDVFCYRLAKYIASYVVPLGQLDAIAFTGGIGENSSLIREKVINLLSFFAFDLDHDANLAARFGNAGVIATNPLGAKVLVMPTNEEWVIAMDAHKLVEAQ
ncbi:acetate kinase [Pseudoalteromonas piratica]|uniref:Acetate kinase n=1 Tax=Pseudoalteromonas piratica TaxID=1348114 RepID=A0A0A7EFR8_9GAMM|nr:acetate kinase [Pseudoalteromonas piratica]AIY65393.1 acetate kinase [Pseudoalteromonas piratica]